MTTVTPKTPLRERIKHHTPEIIAGVAVVAGVVSLIYIRKNLNELSVADAFASHAADESVEIITGGEEAFACLSKAAAEMLDTVGSITLDEWDTGAYVLSKITK